MQTEAAPPAGAPRKHGKGKKNTETIESSGDEGGPSQATVDTTPGDKPALATIAYSISPFTLAQMKKDSKKRGDSKIVLMELEDELVWDTWKAQLLVKIDKVLKPKKISFDNYDITFSIPHVHPKPTMLSNEGSYKFMSDDDEKKNNNSDDSDDGVKASRTKSKKKANSADLPGNKAIA